jgi:hypothetical protein
MAFAVVLLAVFAAVATYAVPQFFDRPVAVDPAEKLRALQARFRAGEKVRLLGETGAPEWVKLMTEPRVSKLHADPDRPYSVMSTAKALVELLPECPTNRYRFRAEVQHADANQTMSRMGIYFFHHFHADGNDTEHSLMELTFADRLMQRDYKPGPRELKLEQIRYTERPSDITAAIPRTLGAGSIQYPEPPAGERPWRTLEMKVDDDALEIFWDGTKVITQSRHVLAKKVALILPPRRPDPVEPFQPTSGLGLYVASGTALFRNVEVQTLP